jgi:heme exporter protein CcmD
VSHIIAWLSMGGYYAYVWSAYGLVGMTLMIVSISVTIQKKRTHKKLQQWFKN